MRALVTGAGGLIGSHLAVALTNNGYHVDAVDDLSGGTWDTINEMLPPARRMDLSFIVMDLRDKQNVHNLFAGFPYDVVYNCAADATEGRSQFMPVFCTENNYMVHLNLITESIRSRVRRFVCFSSMACYGRQNPPFDERLKREPEDIYGIAKAAIEHSTEVLSKVHGLEYVIIRPHNIYGEGQMMDTPYRGVVSIWINACMRGKKFYIFGDGTQMRAFSYIGDIIPCLIRAGSDPAVVGETINLGAATPVTLNRLAEIVRGHFPGMPDPEYIPLRPLEVSYAWSTIDKSVRLLGFEDKTSLEDGIKRHIEWAKKRGPCDVKYIDLELVSASTPKSWTSQLY